MLAVQTRTMMTALPSRAPDANADLDIGRLFDAHAEELCRMVHRMTGSREVAEDLVQEAFITAWRRRGDLNDPTHVRAWLYRVTLNHVRHRRRSFARFARFIERFGAQTQQAEPPPLQDDFSERKEWNRDEDWERLLARRRTRA